MSLEAIWNALYLFIGALISGLVGVFVEQYRRYLEYRDRHFMEIKESCLKPIQEALYELGGYFVFREDEIIMSPQQIDEALGSEIKWWENFSFRNRPGVNPLLYDDLSNHYKDLVEALKELEKNIPVKYSKFLQLIKRLSEAIWIDPEYRRLKEHYEGSAIDDVRSITFRAIFYLSLGVDKGIWPNLYTHIREKKKEVLYLGEKFYRTSEAEELRGLQAEVLSMVDSCIRRVDEILLESKLRGKCKYIR